MPSSGACRQAHAQARSRAARPGLREGGIRSNPPGNSWPRGPSCLSTVRMRSQSFQNRCSVIIIDTNPFAGEHLRLLLMQSHYYIIMAGPDRGSTNAIQKLCEMVPEWYKTTVNNTIHKVHRNAGTEQLRTQYPFKKTAPKFLGIVLGNFASRKNNAEPDSEEVFSYFSQGLSTDMPSNKYRATMSMQWLEAKHSREKLEKYTFHDERDGFAEVVQFAPHGAVYEQHNLVTGLIGRVRNFAGFKVSSEHFGIPVPFLEPRHLEIEWDAAGEIKKQKRPTPKNIQSVQFFRKLYDQIAWNILALIHTDSSGHERPPWVNLPADWRAWRLGGPPGAGEDVFGVMDAPDGQDRGP